MALQTGPVSPYVTPDLLEVYPTGVSWSTIPSPKATDAERYAAQVLLCQAATGMTDVRANQIMRATQQTEQLFGPGFRVNPHSSGLTRLLLSERPVIQVAAIQVALAASFPWQFTQVTPGSWAIERPPLLLPGTSAAADAGAGGQAVLLGPGYVNGGSHGTYVIQTTYVAGWPHCGITKQASAGDMVLNVDDTTGWDPAGPSSGVTDPNQGATGTIQDNANGQEAVTCLAASTQTGPGILTLSAPLQYAHPPGILVTTMPPQIQWASTLYAASMALTRGATATTVQTLGGRPQATMSGADDLKKMGDAFLAPFSRVM